MIVVFFIFIFMYFVIFFINIMFFCHTLSQVCGCLW